MSEEAFSPFLKIIKKIKPLKTISFILLYIFFAFWGGKILSYFFGSISYVFTFLSPSALLLIVSNINEVNIGKTFYKCWGNLSNKEHFLIIIDIVICWIFFLSIKESIKEMQLQKYEGSRK